MFKNYENVLLLKILNTETNCVRKFVQILEKRKCREKKDALISWFLSLTFFAD